jgi:AraC-like DNA-binding protein
MSTSLMIDQLPPTDDPLTAGLRALRMRGSLFSRAEMAAPFGVRSGPLPFGVFHAVVTGRCILRTPDHGSSKPVELVEGDVVYLPHGSDHILADTEWRAAAPRSTIGTRPGPDGMELLQVPGDGDQTVLLCGRVEINDSDRQPVLQLLPDVVHVSQHTSGVGAQIPMLINLIAAELAGRSPGSAATVARLTDVLVLHMIRHHVEHLAHTDTGWLRAMSDPQISQAIGLIHNNPAQPWTAAGLAREIGLSRSAFFGRFSRLVGEGPIEYLTRWRMHVASHQLRDGESVANTARAVGYASEASFSDAFLRITGTRPGTVRAQPITV